MEIEIAGKKINTVYAMGDNHVKVDLQMRTNIPGCFACGDIAGKPYQYIKAAGQGNVAALYAVEYLSKWRGLLTANCILQYRIKTRALLHDFGVMPVFCFTNRCFVL